jgi:hypothetical protein
MAKWYFLPLLGLGLLTASTPAPASRLDAVRPIVLSLSDTAPVAGETVTVTVTLNQASPDNETLNISSLNLGAYSSIPSSVAINQGDTQETFQVTMANNFFGLAVITASTSSGQASAAVMVLLPLGL